MDEIPQDEWPSGAEIAHSICTLLAKQNVCGADGTNANTISPPCGEQCPQGTANKQPTIHDDEGWCPLKMRKSSSKEYGFGKHLHYELILTVTKIQNYQIGLESTGTKFCLFQLWNDEWHEMSTYLECAATVCGWRTAGVAIPPEQGIILNLDARKSIKSNTHFTQVSANIAHWWQHCTG